MTKDLTDYWKLFLEGQKGAVKDKVTTDKDLHKKYESETSHDGSLSN